MSVLAGLVALVMSASLRKPTALGVAAVEAAAALALLFDQARALGAAMACVVAGLYALALCRQLGETLDCGCRTAKGEKRLEGADVARALVLAATSAAILVVGPANWTVASAFGAVGFFALWVAWREMGATPRPTWKAAA